MVESFSQSSVVDGSESSQYGRKPNTSRRRPPGSTAAARRVLIEAEGSTEGASMGPDERPGTVAGPVPAGESSAGCASRIDAPDSRPAGSASGEEPSIVQ